jgi:hypothetical protein
VKQRRIPSFSQQQLPKQWACCDHQFTDHCSKRESPTHPRSSPLRLDPQASPDGASRRPLGTGKCRAIRQFEYGKSSCLRLINYDAATITYREQPGTTTIEVPAHASKRNRFPTIQLNSALRNVGRLVLHDSSRSLAVLAMAPHPVCMPNNESHTDRTTCYALSRLRLMSALPANRQKGRLTHVLLVLVHNYFQNTGTDIYLLSRIMLIDQIHMRLFARHKILWMLT